MNLIITDNYEEMSQEGAKMILRKILSSKQINLGLATGSTPLGLYKELVKYVRENNINLSGVVTFNLDEYIGILPTHQGSFHYYMEKNVFGPLNIPENQRFIPDGMAENILNECRNYEKKIQQYGGIDFQLLGVGENGHIGFNEPGTDFTKTTHVVELTETTRQANKKFFGQVEDVPGKAITMGISTILRAREILLIANGVHKAEAIYQLFHGEYSKDWPVTALQKHKNVCVIVDQEAASLLIKQNNLCY